MVNWFFRQSAILALLLVMVGCQNASSQKTAPTGVAMVVSVSSDGRHAVSSHSDNRLVLWDLIERRRTVIAKQANIYSAFFVPNKNIFIWQDFKDVVHIQGIDGKKIKSFQHFPTYGHVLTENSDHYVSCDENWNIYLGYGKEITLIKNDGNSPSFLGIGKLLNLTLSYDGNFLLSAGTGFDVPDERPILSNSPINPKKQFSNYAGVVLWDLLEQKPVAKFPGHEAKTTAILSPDGKCVISGSENGIAFVREALTGKVHVELASLHHGVMNKNGTEDYEKWTFDKTGLIPPPSDLDSNEAILAFRFIDKKHYLCFLTYSPYAVLYHIDNPLPLKYLPLGRNPFPAVSDYPRNAAMDTAPEAGILVMGQRDGGGIIVYKYHPEKQELQKVWVAE